jgi:spore maturation protein A
MLNYIWLTLILLGTGVAVWSDWRDASTNRYHNGAAVECLLLEDADGAGGGAGDGGTARIAVTAAAFDAAYAGAGGPVGADVVQRARFLSKLPPAGQPGSVGVEIVLGPDAPPAWKEIQAGQKTGGFLRATLRTDGSGRWTLSADPVRFVRLNAVTNDGIVKYAKVAVELAIGLIGIMSLWLGLMKIAEQAGMVAVLAKFLKPVTTRLFPDVPADHPAMGAMLMNISANMLGLANAATPLGLKAMEELNKLNKKLGTATDAMCTFLVINTSSVQLIPATVIAIRAASGSANPTEIIGPVIFATTINTLVGIATVKLLAKLRIFRAAAEGGKA